MAKQEGSRVVTNEVRLSYVFLNKPQVDAAGKESYSVCVMLPKSDKETAAVIRAAHKVAYADAVVKTWGGKKAEVKDPLRDGDVVKAGQEEFKGMWFFNAKTFKKPTVIDLKTRAVANEDEIYSGMWAKLSLNLYGYNNKESKAIGVTYSLNGVLKTKDDTDLAGGGGNAFADFADDLGSEDDILGFGGDTVPF